MSKGLERRPEHYSYPQISYLVIDRNTGKQLNSSQILIEVNRDRSQSWDSFTLEDLEASPQDVLGWLSPDFYSITYC